MEGLQIEKWNVVIEITESKNPMSVIKSVMSL
jgi:hypothetical protein